MILYLLVVKYCRLAVHSSEQYKNRIIRIDKNNI